jgi:hypothetical protein
MGPVLNVMYAPTFYTKRAHCGSTPKYRSSAGLRFGEVVLDVGTGVGVLIPLIQINQPRAEMRHACFGQVGVSWSAIPKGVSFVDQLRATTDLFI